MKANRTLAILFVLAVVFCGRVFADECAEKEARFRERGAVFSISALSTRGCIGGDSDNSDLFVRLREMLPEERGAVYFEDVRGQVTSALDLINSMVQSYETEVPYSRRVLDDMSAELFRIRAAIAAGDSTSEITKPGYWRFDPNDFTVSGREWGLRDALASACQPEDSSSFDSDVCDDVYEDTKAIVRFVAATREVLSRYRHPVIHANYEAAKRRLSQWNAYFDEARFQYPWELALNSAWIGHHDSRPVDDNGNRLGFMRPPTSQWILLHPQLGLEYVDEAQPGKEMDTVAYLEVIGFNKWHWTEEGDMGFALGGAIIASLGDRPDVNNVGVGVSVFLNNRLTLGMTVYDTDFEDVGIVLSTDLAQSLTSVSQDARQALMEKVKALGSLPH